MKRLPNEIFEYYKIRRRNENNRIKAVLKGRVFWNSSLKGTYKKLDNGIK